MRWPRATSMLLVALAVLTSLAASAQAATYTAGDAKDVPGTCANPAAGTCSLRQLIDYENKLAATPNPTDTIVVPAGTYTLANGELEITQSLSIEGAGARKTHVELTAGGAPARAFSVKTPARGKTPSVLISGLEISGGTAGESNGYFGGDVYNAGELVLAEDWITGGTASSGGGISNDTGTLVVERSLVSGNQASTGGGDSGGIQNHGSAVCIEEEEEEEVCSPGKRGVLTVDDSTVAENDARLGAGIFSWSDDGVADENEVTIIDSTIADNTTKEETGGAARGPGAGLLIYAGTADVAGSILAYNAEIEEEYIPTNCSVTRPATIHSDGYNLDNGTECGFTSEGDLQQTFPDFSSGELQNNGGETNTLGLEPTSPAVDAVPKGSPYCDGTDQRGVPRPQGAGCAIGAFELVPFTIEAVEGTQFSGELATAGCSISGVPTIEWGDGQTSEATVIESFIITGAHTYEEAGTYNGSVNYEDDCGTHKVPFRAEVADAPLSASGEALSGTAGVKLTGTVAKFTDANPDGKVSDYTASIDWGDESTSTGTIKAAEGGGFLVSGSHTYAAVGNYKITVTIKDVGGSEAVASSTAKITGPPVISEVKAGTVTETTAKVEFTLAPEGLETTYEVEYGPTESYGQKSGSAKLAAESAPTREAVSLTGLKAGSTYHFRVVAKNAQAPAGVSSADKTFATLGPPVISEVKTAGITETTAKVEFILAPAGSEATYEVEYGLTESYGQKSASAKLAGGAGPTPEVVSLSGLKAGSTYHFRVVAKNAQAPAGVDSADMTFATLGPPVISGVGAGSITEATAKVEFTLAPAGSETTYEVEYGLTESYGQKSASAKLAGGAGPTHEAVALSGLKAHDTYHFRVVAKNAQAPGGVHSEDKTFATLGPPVISEVTAGSITETTAKVEFKLDPAGSETTYEVEYGLTESYGQKSASAKLAGGAGPTHEAVALSGLKAGSTYHFRVVAKNAQAPAGVDSADMTFGTLGPPVITEVGAGSITETSAKVEFTLAPAGSETTYEVEYGLTESYGQKSASAKLAGGAGPTHEAVALSGLKANSTYHFRVVAKNAQAPAGVSSADKAFATLGPPVISEVKSASITEISAKVEFTLDPAGSETTYEVEYGLTEAYGQKSASAKLAGGAGPTHEAVALSGLKAGSTYHFRVVAKNAQAPGGVASADMAFATLGPPVISGVGVGSIAETSATVEFILAPAGSETTYEVEYGLTESYGQKSASAKLAGGAGPTHEVVALSGLKADGTYHFRVVAKNAQAPGGVHGEDKTFATLGPPVISEVTAGSITETTARVEFKLDPAGSETTYEVEYGLTESYGQKSASAKLAGGAGPTREAVALSGLKVGSAYHFRVVAKNAQAPVGVDSADMTFGTLGPPVISGVGVGSITEATAKVEFTLAPAGSETTYEVEYGLTESYGQKSASAKLAGGAGPTHEAVALSGLKAHDTYHFRVVAKNAQAPAGVDSADMVFVTLGPPVISEVTAGSITETAAAVEFTLAPAGSETTYEVEYGLTEAYGQKSASAKLVGSAGPTHEVVTLSGLKAGASYHFRVVARNAQAPSGVHSADTSFVTLGPPVISEVTAGSITETSAKVEFTLDPAGSETMYEVEYGPTEAYGQKSASAKLASGAGPTHETVTLSGLKAGSTFYFRVVAKNAQASTGVASVVEHFTTEPPPGGGGGSPGGGPLGQQGVSGFQSSSPGGATLGALPPPVLGVNVNVDVVSGKVFVAYPPGSQLASLSDVLEASLASPLQAIESLSKGLHFVPLTEARQIPVGSVLETTAGVARIETATASINKPQFGNFGAGIFKLLQARKQKGLTELDIMNVHTARQVCASLGKVAAVAAKLSSKVLGRLNANAHGKFTTKGQYSAATVRGTVWNVANQCDGTLTKVQRGVVSVRDFVRRKTITLFTGMHYLARP